MMIHHLIVSYEWLYIAAVLSVVEEVDDEGPLLMMIMMMMMIDEWGETL